jgi:hypothetical protein
MIQIEVILEIAVSIAGIGSIGGGVFLRWLKKLVF